MFGRSRIKSNAIVIRRSPMTGCSIHRTHVSACTRAHYV